jgi:hypothetical protein
MCAYKPDTQSEYNFMNILDPKNLQNVLERALIRFLTSWKSFSSVQSAQVKETSICVNYIFVFMLKAYSN